MTVDRRVFVDTNVLIRATISSAPLHHEARLALDRLWDDRAELVISHQVVREYIANITRPQTYSRAVPIADVLAQVSDFRKTFLVLPEPANALDELIEIVRAVPVGGKQIHDANIVAVMLAHGVQELLTHNVVDFERYSDYIRVRALA